MLVQVVSQLDVPQWPARGGGVPAATGHRSPGLRQVQRLHHYMLLARWSDPYIRLNCKLATFHGLRALSVCALSLHSQVYSNETACGTTERV